MCNRWPCHPASELCSLAKSAVCRDWLEEGRALYEYTSLRLRLSATAKASAGEVQEVDTSQNVPDCVNVEVMGD